MSRRVLIFGHGWLGSTWSGRLPDVVVTDADIADAHAVEEAFDAVRPDRVVNAAGKTGHPNVDALEGEPALAYRSNVIGPLVLATSCRRRGIHMTHLSSGCVYTGDNEGRGYGEEDPPNFSGSLYARTKILAERALRDFGVLQLRVRMPLSSFPHARNLLTKLLGYERTVSIPNSVTVLEDAWPVAEALMEQGRTGVWNLVNDGVERHDELLHLWRERVEPERRVEVVPEAALGLKAGRSNCVLSTAKLHAAGLALRPLSESLPELVDAYARHLEGSPRL